MAQPYPHGRSGSEHRELDALLSQLIARQAEHDELTSLLRYRLGVADGPSGRPPDPRDARREFATGARDISRPGEARIDPDTLDSWFDLRGAGGRTEDGALEDDVNRREFLATVAGLALIGPGPLLEGVGRRLVDELTDLTATLASCYWRMSPSALLPSLHAHQLHLHRLLAGSVGSSRPQLETLAAETAVLAGLNAYRQNDLGTARAQLVNAEGLARDANNPATMAAALAAHRALVSAASVGGRDGNPTRAIEMLDEAVRMAGDCEPPQLRIWVYASRAEELAAIGRTDAAMRDLALAQRALAKSGKPAVGFYDHWNEARLAGWQASVLLHLGREKQAVPILESAVNSTPNTLVGPHSAVLADLGAALAASGEPERAAKVLLRALTHATERGINDGIARVATVRARHLKRYSELHAVRELDEALTAA